MINMTCPKCSEVLSVPDSLAGGSEACPACGNVCPVPTPVTVAPSPPLAARASPVPQPLVAAAGVTVNIEASSAKSTNGLGVAALVLGIIAALTCWIPFIGILSIPLAVLGCLLGFIGLLIALIGRRSGVGMPISGLVVCIVSIVIAVSMTGVATIAIDEAIKEAGARSAPPAGAATPPRTGVVAPTPSNVAPVSVVELLNVTTGKTVLDQQGVFGEIKNVGTRSVSRVDIRVYALNAAGEAIWDDDYSPVHVVTDSLFTEAQEPLKPNYSRKWGYAMDGLSSEYSGKVRVVVEKVEYVK